MPGFCYQQHNVTVALYAFNPNSGYYDASEVQGKERPDLRRDTLCQKQ
ncbi:hypothetical protein [Vibrio mytili]|nr:hypothetical protein [Vibrio mytili]